MEIKVSYFWILASFLTISLVNCTGASQLNNRDVSIPSSWLPLTPQDSVSCLALDGTYAVLGQGKINEGNLLTETRLDAALGHTIPSDRMPKKVYLSGDKGKGTLKIRFGDPINKSFPEKFECFEGWHVITQSSSDTYLGDGTDLEYSTRKIELAKATDGSLIVHLILEAKFKSLFVFRTRAVKEIWSKYEALGAD